MMGMYPQRSSMQIKNRENLIKDDPKKMRYEKDD